MASRRGLTWLPAALWIGSLSAAIAATVIAPDTAAVTYLVELAPVGLAYATVGALLASRRPENPVGWLFATWGLAMTTLGVAETYVSRVPAPPGVEWVAWAIAVLWHPLFVLLVFQLLLFPHGQLPSPRWRHFARLTVVVYAALALSAAFSPSASQLYAPGVEPLFSTPIGPVADTVFESLLSFQLVLVATSMVSLVLRLRHARGRERQQIKGFVYAVIVAVTTFIAGIFVFGAGVLFGVFALIPIAAGIAILRQQLYDIDRVINRTAVYGVLSALLALVYAAGVVGLGQIFGRASDVAVAGSTLFVAALFRPARQRVQQVVDRRFNRRRYDAARLASAFSQQCREEVDLDAIATGLSAAVAQAMEPAHLALWWDPAARRGSPGISYREVAGPSGRLSG